MKQTLCYCMAMAPDMALRDTPGFDFTMALSGGWRQETQSRLFLPILSSSVSSLFIMFRLFCFSLSPHCQPRTSKW